MVNIYFLLDSAIKTFTPSYVLIVLRLSHTHISSQTLTLHKEMEVFIFLLIFWTCLTQRVSTNSD